MYVDVMYCVFCVGLLVFCCVVLRWYVRGARRLLLVVCCGLCVVCRVALGVRLVFRVCCLLLGGPLPVVRCLVSVVC